MGMMSECDDADTAAAAEGAAIYLLLSGVMPARTVAAEAACRAYANQQGLRVDEAYVYHEQPVASAEWYDRPLFASMLHDALLGRFSALIAPSRQDLLGDDQTRDVLTHALRASGVSLHILG